ncbi:MAG: hypothetical protein AAFR04_15060, partial [Pseudomonadota bacterium]
MMKNIAAQQPPTDPDGQTGSANAAAPKTKGEDETKAEDTTKAEARPAPTSSASDAAAAPSARSSQAADGQDQAGPKAGRNGANGNALTNGSGNGAASTFGPGQQPAQPVGWLATLKTKLGLPGGSTLRTNLEYALRNGDDPSNDFTVGERDMLLRLLTFGQLRVEDVMVPRADIIAIDENESVEALLE